MDVRSDERWMQAALKEAQAAARDGEVPVGAILVEGGRVLGRSGNQVERLRDPTAHAEILAITQAASARGDWRLNGTTLYVTKEPCPMCAGAIVHARITRVVWGVTDPLRGGAVSLCNLFQNPALNHRVAFEAGVLEAECRDLLQSFFQKRRAEAESGDAG